MAYDIAAPQGRFEGKVFVFPARVYYEDTDAGGVVYYANYLKYAERARTEFIRSLGVNQQPALEEDRCGFMVRSIEVDYKAPAVLDDLLSVTCVLTEAKGATAEMLQEIWRGETLLVVMKVKLAYVSLARKRPMRLPAFMMQAGQAVPA